MNISLDRCLGFLGEETTLSLNSFWKLRCSGKTQIRQIAGQNGTRGAVSISLWVCDAN